MYCEETQRAIESSNFGTGTLTLNTLCQAHLSQCRECQEYAKEYALPDILRSVTHAPVPDYLEDRILGPLTPTPKPQRHTLWWWLSSATAAVVLVVSLAIIDFSKVEQPIPNYVMVSVDEVQQVRLMLASKTDLTDARVRVALSDNIAVSGFNDSRELNWKTNLKEGNNMLVLPIQLLQPSNGKIEVVLEHQGSSKSYTINVSPKPVAPNEEPVPVS